MRYSIHSIWCVRFVVALLAASLASNDVTADDAVLKRGANIYRAKCAACHGPQGEGAKDGHEEALIGDATVGELAALITKTMPEDDPDACAGDDAAAVAAWIHQAFYSRAARLRNRPPRVALSRLTRSQLARSLADLYGHFSGSADAKAPRGLKGVYYDGAKMRRNKVKFERVDPQLDFDFGFDGPGEGLTPDDFAIQWTGGLQAKSTGLYEIIIRSSSAFVCDFGAYGRQFVNNHVQSGDRTEFRQSIVLGSGRIYPLRISLYHRKRKTGQPPAKFQLSWVPPNGTEQVIPQRQLVATWVPPTFALQTQMPPDDRSYGYERGISVDRQWDEATTAAALEFADTVARDLWPRHRARNKRRQGRNSENESPSGREHLRAFLVELVGVAFRGPLTEEIRSAYVDRQLAATEDDAEAIRRIVLMTLKSPRFLYPLLPVQRSSSQYVGNRLALTLFDSLPSDKWLLDRINSDALSSTESIRNTAQRMVNDVRTKAKARDLFDVWLDVSASDVNKSEAFAGFDAAVVSDLRDSMDAFIDDIVWSEESQFQSLFTTDWTYTTDRLAALYGEAWQPQETTGAVLRKSVPAAEERFGLLTHPYLMSHLAYNDATSPIHRGVFLFRSLLGRTLRPPNESFTPFTADLHPDLTTRQRVMLQTKAANCQVCHSKINGLGFILENYDPVGRFRSEDNAKSIDATGWYTTRTDKRRTFAGPRELATFLATSEESQRAFVSRAFRHFVKQPAAAYGPETIDRLTKQFADNGCRVRDLFVEIAVIAATDEREVSSPDPSVGAK